MLVYKFGGASVKSAKAVIKVAEIIKKSTNDIVVVISAMGKITNAFEELLDIYINKNKNVNEKLQFILNFHQTICEELFGNYDKSPVFEKISSITDKLRIELQKKPTGNYDFEYDRIVSFGELYSTTIVSEYLNSVNLKNKWIDIRTVLKTDSNFREAIVNMKLSEKLAKDCFLRKKTDSRKIYITQGFIASDFNNNNTTLGREGSDYTAALLGNFLNSEKVVFWKDVPGIMNADPVWYGNAFKIDEMNYREAIELAFYGAKVIHPKTIKPLQNKNISMVVKSFVNPKESGTNILSKDIYIDFPLYILKTNQILISISKPDLSFILEQSLSEIFKIIASRRAKINLMQNSAVSFTICCDYDEWKTDLLLNDLKEKFEVLYNVGVSLLTIRHYINMKNNEIFDNKTILMEQKSRNISQYVFK